MFKVLVMEEQPHGKRLLTTLVKRLDHQLYHGELLDFDGKSV